MHNKYEYYCVGCMSILFEGGQTVQSASMEILHCSRQYVASDGYHGCLNVSLKFYNRVCNGIWYPSETPMQRIHMG